MSAGNLLFLSVSWSPSPVRLCRSCLRRFGDLRKNTPLEFWSMYLADFVIFNDFRAPQALCGCVAAACGASAPSKKTRPWIFGVCILWILSFFNDFRVQQMLRSVGATRNKG